MTTIFTSHKFSLNECPPNLQKNLSLWSSLNPSYEFKYYNDEEMNRWMKKNSDKETLSLFNKLNSGAARADVFRVCHLYVEGGVWADADLPAFDISKQRPDFQELLSENEGILVHNRKCNEPRYTLMASMKNNDIFAKLNRCINEQINVAIQTNSKLGTIHITGPFVLHKMLCDLLDLESIKGLARESKHLTFVYINDIVPERDTYQEENVYVGYAEDLRLIGVTPHGAIRGVG